MVEKERKNSVYVVSITGSNTNFEVPISNLEDFRDLENILELLKRKLRG